MNVDELRTQFPVTRRCTYFDHAAVASMSGPAQMALVEWAIDAAENGILNEMKWLRRIEEVRARAATLLGAQPNDVAFVKNTTEGIGFVAEGLPWQAGDNVVTAADEYPTNLYPWMNLAHRGVEVRRVASVDGRIRIDDLREAMDARTRVVTLSFVEYATGFRNDLDAVGALCREKGVLFFVDAIQGLGAIPLDVGKTPIDFLASGGHKWLLGPKGAGLFWIRPELVDRLHPVSVGWNSVVHAFDFARVELNLKPDARRWESGTMDFGAILGLGASIELLLQCGIETVWRRIVLLTDHLCRRAEQAGCRVYSSRADQEKSGIVSLELKRDPAGVVKQCRREAIVVNHRAGRLRVSPHCYNTLEEIDRLVHILGDS